MLPSIDLLFVYLHVYALIIIIIYNILLIAGLAGSPLTGSLRPQQRGALCRHQHRARPSREWVQGWDLPPPHGEARALPQHAPTEEGEEV